MSYWQKLAFKYTHSSNPSAPVLQNQNVDRSKVEGLPFLIPPDVAAQPWQLVAMTIIQKCEIKVKEAREFFESSGTETARSPYSEGS